MRKLIALCAVVVTLCLSPFVAAQGALPVVPDPAECGIAPRDEVEIAAVAATPSAETATAGASAGEPADHATAAFALSIVREALACGNAHGFAGATALLSDAALGRDVLDGEPVAFLTFIAGDAAPASDARRARRELRELVLHRDGRVGAVALLGDPANQPVVRRFVLVLAEGVAGTGDSGQYLFLIDGVTAAPGGSATPAP